MLVGAQVEVRATRALLNIYAGGKRVACNPCSTRVSQHTTLNEHMPLSHRHHAEYTPERFERWAADIGNATHGQV